MYILYVSNVNINICQKRLHDEIKTKQKTNKPLPRKNMLFLILIV